MGDYYLRQRFYDTDTGRFTRRDAYEGRRDEPLTLHKYVYAHSNPINFVDPTGLFTSLNEVNASQTISNTLERQRDNMKIQALKRFVAKDHELFAAFHVIFRQLTPHAFMYASYPRLASTGRVERFDVGAINGWEAIQRPFSEVAGGLQSRIVFENSLPKLALKRKVAQLDPFRYAVWKAAIRAIPSAEGYTLLGNNCITWTVTASALAKALERSTGS